MHVYQAIWSQQILGTQFKGIMKIHVFINKQKTCCACNGGAGQVEYVYVHVLYIIKNDGCQGLTAKSQCGNIAITQRVKKKDSAPPSKQEIVWVPPRISIQLNPKHRRVDYLAIANAFALVMADQTWRSQALTGRFPNCSHRKRHVWAYRKCTCPGRAYRPGSGEQPDK